jgi:hypothetical protein
MKMLPRKQGRRSWEKMEFTTLATEEDSKKKIISVLTVHMEDTIG